MWRLMLRVFSYLLRFWLLARITRSIKMGNVLNRDKSNQYQFESHKFKLIKPNPRSVQVPVARSGHRIVCDSANLYSFGGYNPISSSYGYNEDELTVLSFPLFQELWRFNFASRKWYRYTSRQSIPVELASNAVILLGSKLIVHGGTGSPFGANCSNKLYTCDVNDETGEMTLMKTTGQPPPPQYGQSLVYDDGYLYSIGGTTGYDYTCDIFRLNLQTHNWEVVYTFNGRGDYEPPGRYRHETAFVDKNIYVLGGGTATEVFNLTEIPTFNLETNRWSVNITHPDPYYADKRDHPKIPKPRKCHGSVQVNTESGPKVYISGGYDGNNTYDDLWCLDLKTFSWKHIRTCSLPEPTYFQAAAITPSGNMYQFGGIVQSSSTESNRSNSVHSLWLCVPKLSEMCWEAILHYNPNIVEYKPKTLLSAGIPRNFVQRIMYD